MKKKRKRGRKAPGRRLKSGKWPEDMRPEERLLCAAQQIIARRGLPSLTVTNVCQEAETASSRFYCHYSGGLAAFRLAVFNYSWLAIAKPFKGELYELLSAGSCFNKAAQLAEACVEGVIQAISENAQATACMLSILLESRGKWLEVMLQESGPFSYFGSIAQGIRTSLEFRQIDWSLVPLVMQANVNMIEVSGLEAARSCLGRPDYLPTAQAFLRLVKLNCGRIITNLDQGQGKPM